MTFEIINILKQDGFYVGELMNGERGLVPSNFVEQIAEEEAILKESDDLGINKDLNGRNRAFYSYVQRCAFFLLKCLVI